MSADIAITQVDINALIDIIALVESRGNPQAIGDNGKSFGILQIGQAYVDDYNAWNGTDYKARDMLGNETLSRTIFKAYMAHYATEKRLGRPVTVADVARIHNGGPNGYKKTATLPYFEKFVAVARRNNFYA